MKVLNIGNGEMGIILKALEKLEETQESLLKEELDVVERGAIEYMVAHTRTTRKLLRDQRLQELCENCLSYFWDHLVEEGTDNPDVEWLADKIGIDEFELKGLFEEAGYEEEY